MLVSIRDEVASTQDAPTERHVTEQLEGMVRNMRPNHEAEALRAIAATCVRRLAVLAQERGR